MTKAHMYLLGVVLLIAQLSGCSTFGSVKYHRAGSDDPLVFGGTRVWMGNDNFVFWTQGMWIIGPFFPILYIFPIGDLLFSSVLDSALLPITIPWALSESLSSATVSDRFDQIVRGRMAWCGDKRRASSDSSCLEVSLKPADPLETEEGRHAVSVNIPASGGQSQIYKPGMNSEEYFSQICKAEAGEFIYKAAENVDGILLMRLRPKITYEGGHLYAPEDPYGLWDDNLRPENFGGRFGYSYIETPYVAPKSYGRPTKEPIGDEKANYTRYETDYKGHSWQVVPKESGHSLKSRYGFTWRGIQRPHDREFGIAGSEVLVVDLKTQEVLGVFRGYAKFEFAPRNGSGTGMAWTRRCPSIFKTTPGGLQREFIMRVLKPIQFSNR